MGRRDLLALVLLVLVAAASKLMQGDADVAPPQQPPGAESPRRPAPEYKPQYRGDGFWDAETRDWLSDAPSRSPNANAPWSSVPRQAVVDIPNARSSGSGTAFAVGDGLWFTARHVIDGCDDVGIQIERTKAIKAQVTVHRNADVALLRTRGGAQPFAIAPDAAVREDGYMVGFPKGSPGAVHARKIGETALRERGRYRTDETADVWAEHSRIPARFGSLGGLSGGPVFNERGQILGAVLAEEPRRGRVFAAQPATLRDLLPQSAHDPDGATFSPSAYPQAARTLITGRRVARVLCRVR